MTQSSKRCGTDDFLKFLLALLCNAKNAKCLQTSITAYIIPSTAAHYCLCRYLFMVNAPYLCIPCVLIFYKKLILHKVNISLVDIKLDLPILSELWCNVEQQVNYVIETVYRWIWIFNGTYIKICLCLPTCQSIDINQSIDTI